MFDPETTAATSPSAFGDDPIRFKDSVPGWMKTLQSMRKRLIELSLEVAANPKSPPGFSALITLSANTFKDCSTELAALSITPLDDVYPYREVARNLCPDGVPGLSQAKKAIERAQQSSEHHSLIIQLSAIIMEHETLFRDMHQRILPDDPPTLIATDVLMDDVFQTLGELSKEANPELETAYQNVRTCRWDWLGEHHEDADPEMYLKFNLDLDYNAIYETLCSIKATLSEEEPFVSKITQDSQRLRDLLAGDLLLKRETEDAFSSASRNREYRE